jgi:hypothetical protein
VFPDQHLAIDRAQRGRQPSDRATSEDREQQMRQSNCGGKFRDGLPQTGLGPAFRPDDTEALIQNHKPDSHSQVLVFPDQHLAIDRAQRGRQPRAQRSAT